MLPWFKEERLMSKRLMAILTALSLAVAACGGDGAADTTTTAPDTTLAADTTDATDATDECALENLDLVNEGVLTAATGEPAFEPWVVDDDPTSQQGFEAAVVYAMAEEMGFTADQVTWTRIGFDEAIAPGPKNFDVNVQQYSITDARDEVVDFSYPYYVTQQALVAFSDSAVTEATSLEELKSYNLGAQIGTTSLDYIEEIIQPDTAPAVYDTNSDAKSALEAGQIDAIVFDLPTAYYITAVEIPEAAIVGALPASEEQADRFGMLMEEGTGLKPCVDRALEALDNDGTLEALAEEWLQQEGDIPELTP
jgi:polar amino acid transport system substrate-binding protein